MARVAARARPPATASGGAGGDSGRRPGGDGDRRRRRARVAAAHGESGKERKGEGVLTGGDCDDRRRGATEGGRHAADGDRDDLKNEKEKIREGERGHRRWERRPKAADMATLTVAQWEWHSGGEPRRRRVDGVDLGHANPTAVTARCGGEPSGG
uniref:OSJNBa0014F04.10 protein n=1 Tax=Oryza sativa subsp. japonica TaxID=39947 RepID=Q7XR37_ORYSJ|nr:OSJNBa0014F04.10 [Oryza sativa Japonica Group]